MLKQIKCVLYLLLLALILTGCERPVYGTFIKRDPYFPASYINSVEIEENTVKIGADGDFKYVVTAETPFRIHAELSELTPGRFKSPITSTHKGIREITFSSKPYPKPSTTVTIALISPMKVKDSYDDGVLTLTFERAGPEVAAPVPVEPQSGSTVEPAPKTVPPYDAKNIISVDYKKDSQSAFLQITADGSIRPKVSKNNSQLIIDIPDAKLSAEVPQNLAPPVKSIKWELKNTGVRFILALDKGTSYYDSELDGSLLITFTSDELVESEIIDSAMAKQQAPTQQAQTQRKQAGKPVARKNARAEKDLHQDTTLPDKVATPEQSTQRPLKSIDSTVFCNDDGFVAETVCKATGISPKLNFDFKSADIVPVFSLLAEASGCNIVINPEDTEIKEKKVTLKVSNSNWYNIANLVLKMYKLACKQEGNIIMIIPASSISKESEERIKRRQDLIKEKELDVQYHQMGHKVREAELYRELPVLEIFKLNYVEASDVKGILMGINVIPAQIKKAGKEPGYMQGALGDMTRAREAAELGGVDLSQKKKDAEAQKSDQSSSKDKQSPYLSPVGTMLVDTRSNSLIVKDIPSSLEVIARLIKELDQPATQVLIEAKIVEISRNASVNLGIEWASFGRSSHNDVGFGGASNPSLGQTGSSYISNFPTPIGSLGGGLLMGILNRQGTFGLDIKLDALAASGEGKVITKPSILTVNRKSATIQQGSQAPYLVTNQYGIGSVAYLSLTTTIEVTPTVIEDGTVILDLNITKQDQTGTAQVAGSDAPQATVLSETTTAMVNNGETLVLGGIITMERTTSTSGLPGLQDIPLIGGLFKTTQEVDNSNEYIIFITPRIIKKKVD